VNASVLLIAGEVSGDMHAAGLVRAVRARAPYVKFFGIGGEALRAAGMDTIYDAREMAVMGLAEVLKRYRFFKKVFEDMVALAEDTKPDAVVLVDYPGFNLRFAERMHRMGIKVIYYICPQVWAWHRSRIAKMAEIVDRLIVIFPFEPQVFAGTSLKVDFVGHPLVDVARRVLAEPLRSLPWRGTRVALLPGSRRQEIDRILPVMAKAAARLDQTQPDRFWFIVAAPSEEIAQYMEKVLTDVKRKPAHLEIIPRLTRQVLHQARAAMVASGTATIEAAFMGCPMVVVYKTSPLTYLIGRQLVKVPHIGMVNIVAGKEICPEYIQFRATPRALADGVQKLVDDAPDRAQMVEELAKVRLALGSGGASKKAAAIVMEELESIPAKPIPTRSLKAPDDEIDSIDVELSG